MASYLSHVVESWLRFEYPGRDSEDVTFWKKKFEHRHHPEDFVISYKSYTEKNDGLVLEFTEKTEIHPWPPPELRAA